MGEVNTHCLGGSSVAEIGMCEISPGQIKHSRAPNIRKIIFNQGEDLYSSLSSYKITNFAKVCYGNRGGIFSLGF